MTAAKEDLIARGANQSNAHIDWMIGSDKIYVDGICQDDKIDSIMQRGEWVNA
jgi:aminopeptidase